MPPNNIWKSREARIAAVSLSPVRVASLLMPYKMPFGAYAEIGHDVNPDVLSLDFFQGNLQFTQTNFAFYTLRHQERNRGARQPLRM